MSDSDEGGRFGVVLVSFIRMSDFDEGGRFRVVLVSFNGVGVKGS